MTLRTTGVKLVADNTQYKRSMRESAKATEELNEHLEDTRTASDKAGESLMRTGKSSGDAFRDMARTAKDLDGQIKVTTDNIAKLGTAYARGGGDDVLKQIKEQQRALKELKSVRNLLPSAGELAAASADVGKGIIGGIRTALSGASPAALGIPALGLLFAPTLGAAVAGAVVGGAALGGIVGGVMLAARSQEVKDAGKELGRSLLGDLQSRANREFVTPVLNSIQRIRQGFGGMGSDLDTIFRSSRFVEPLVDGGLKGAKAFVSGFADAVEAADPVVEALRQTTVEVLGATGNLFRTMAGDAKEGASAIEDLTGNIVMMIEATGQIIHTTAQIKGAADSFDSWADSMRYRVEDLNNQVAKSSPLMRALGIHLDITADGFTAGSREAEAYRKATLGTATATDFATLKTAGMSDAQIAAADSSGRFRGELERLQAATQHTTVTMGTLVASEQDVKDVNQQLAEAQKALTQSIQMMNPAMYRATQLTTAMKTATQQLYGATESAIDANESYEASWDSLSDAVKSNGRSLDIHTQKGRANRDALQGMLSSSRELYFAQLNSGTAEDTARKAHERRTAAIREEARRLGLNREETNKLITSYGRIPKKSETQVIQKGVDAVVKKFMDLYVYQQSLAQGLPIGTVTAMLNNEKGPAKRYGGYAEGGHTGHGGKYEPAGVVHREEFVLRSEATKKLERENPGVLDEMNATGQLPGYARGGWVGAFPVNTSNYRVPVTADRTKTPSREQVAAKVMPKFDSGNWPSSPSAQRGDSGVWRRIKKFLEDANMGGSFGNGYRPGDPKWHGSGRAVDWMGYNLDSLATRLAGMKPLELIHRTNRRDYAYTRGRNKGSFNNSLMEAHRNHIHIAMADGGTIREPVLGVGASGRTYSFGENYRPERVTPLGSSGGGGGSSNVFNINVAAAVGQHPVEIGKAVLAAIRPALNAGATVVLNNGTRVL